MRASVALAAVTLAVVALSGCGSDEPEAIPTPASTPTTERATTSPSQSPSATETMSAERAAAERALDRFLQVEAELYANPNADVSALDDVSYGLARETAGDFVRQYRERGFVITGPTLVISREVAKNDLRRNPPTLVIEECRDTSQVEITQNGSPAKGVTTTDREKTTYGVSFWQNKWQASFIEPSGPDAC